MQQSNQKAMATESIEIVMKEYIALSASTGFVEIGTLILAAQYAHVKLGLQEERVLDTLKLMVESGSFTTITIEQTSGVFDGRVTTLLVLNNKTQIVIDANTDLAVLRKEHKERGQNLWRLADWTASVMGANKWEGDALAVLARRLKDEHTQYAEEVLQMDEAANAPKEG